MTEALQKELISLTRQIFELPANATIELTPIFKGGSERNFYRTVLPDARISSVIVMCYSIEREENAYYADIGCFLGKLGIHAPEIYFHDSAKRLVWMEDLGEKDLYAEAFESWAQRKNSYHLVLKEIQCLHHAGIELWKQFPVRLMAGFDERLYSWEHQYFLENFVSRYCQIELSAEKQIALDAELNDLGKRLCQEPICLIHRDFQSQNVLLKNGAAFLIDFQGMRQGTRFYDLGSLLFDPYVPFKEEQRLELLRFYFELDHHSDEKEWERFQTRFYEASAQRLMQALGAYGFLGKVKGKTDFLKYIPAGLKNLASASSQANSLPQLQQLILTLSECVCNRTDEAQAMN